MSYNEKRSTSGFRHMFCNIFVWVKNNIADKVLKRKRKIIFDFQK